MSLERTFSIIKPDATRRNLTGQINAKFEAAGLRIVAQKRIHMSKGKQVFFTVCTRKDRFTMSFASLCPLRPLLYRCSKVKMQFPRTAKMGQPTQPMPQPERSAQNFESVGENSVHGSDAPETAEEIAYFFSE